jgi:hypothetical protein
MVQKSKTGRMSRNVVGGLGGQVSQRGPGEYIVYMPVSVPTSTLISAGYYMTYGMGDNEHKNFLYQL